MDAAAKHSGITEDDKEVRLSHKRIRDMIPRAASFAVLFPLCFSACQMYDEIIADVISNDAELLEKYNEVEKYYQEQEDKKRKAGELK